MCTLFIKPGTAGANGIEYGTVDGQWLWLFVSNRKLQIPFNPQLRGSGGFY